MNIEAIFFCGICGSPNGILVDPTGGSRQEYVEDCQVCCCPHLLSISVDAGDASATVSAEPC